MKKYLLATIILLAAVATVGCASGNAWYYPYGPSYFGGDEPVDDTPKTVTGFLSQPRPK